MFKQNFTQKLFNYFYQVSTKSKVIKHSDLWWLICLNRRHWCQPCLWNPPLALPFHCTMYFPHLVGHKVTATNSTTTICPIRTTLFNVQSFSKYLCHIWWISRLYLRRSGFCLPRARSIFCDYRWRIKSKLKIYKNVLINLIYN